MKIRVTIEFDIDSGEYELQYKNISHPGTSIDANHLTEAVRRILGDFDKQTGGDISITDVAPRGDN